MEFYFKKSGHGNCLFLDYSIQAENIGVYYSCIHKEIELDFSNIIGFDWDDDNLYKNIDKHNAFDTEAEQVFFKHPLVVKPDVKHSEKEERFYALERSNHDRQLFIAFTIQSDKIRVISARDMTKREIRVYENYEERTS